MISLEKLPDLVTLVLGNNGEIRRNMIETKTVNFSTNMMKTILKWENLTIVVKTFLVNVG